MKVLHINAGNLYGGVETVLITLATHHDLCPQMESHFAVCFKGRLSEELHAVGARVRDLGEVRTRNVLKVRRARTALRNLIRREGFDLVICHAAWAQAIFGRVARQAGLPVVFWLHDPPQGRLHWLEHWARFTRPDLVLCNSEYTISNLDRLYPGVEAEVVYCPVPNQGSSYSDDECAALRAEFNTPQDATVIIQVGRLEPHKGHLFHLQGLARLRELPGWVLWQVGAAQRPHENQYLERIKSTAKELGIEDRVRFLGWQPDVRKLMAVADIYCQPNTEPEPFGLTFIEALLSGKPLVATALGGPKEIVNDLCGILVPPGDVDALAEALRGLIRDQPLRLRLGGAGPLRAYILCDPANRIRQLNKFLTRSVECKAA